MLTTFTSPPVGLSEGFTVYQTTHGTLLMFKKGMKLQLYSVLPGDVLM